MTEKRYSEKELKKILKKALDKQRDKTSGYSKEDVMAAAAEMGVAESVVEELLKKHQKEETKNEPLEVSSKRAFYIHLTIFLIMNVLFLITGQFGKMGPPMMRLFPFFPWIFILGAHAFIVFKRP